MKAFRVAPLLLLIAAAPPGDVSFKEKLLAQIPDDVHFKDIAFSPTGEYVAYIGTRGGRQHVVLNNAFGPAYAVVADKPQFTRDGKTVIYRGSPDGKNWRVNVGGKEGPVMAFVGPPVVSPDGSKYAFHGMRAGQGNSAASASAMWVGGRKGKDWARCGQPYFSADGKSYAHGVSIAKPGTANRANFTTDMMLYNGKPVTPEVEKISSPFFAPKGQNFAFRVGNGGLWVMWENKKPHAEQFLTLGDPVWSPDGKRLAYKGSTDGRQWFMVVDGEKQGPYDFVGDPIWHPKSTHVAFRAQKGPKWFIQNGTEEIGEHRVAENPVFSPDGTIIAYPGSDGRKWRMHWGDKVGMGDLDAIYSSPVFSPDGKHIAYRAGWRFKWIVVIDDGKNQMWDEVGEPVWAPTSDKVAYHATKEGKKFMVVHYRTMEPFDEILTPPVWNKSGTKVAFGCRKDRALYWRVVEAAK